LPNELNQQMHLMIRLIHMQRAHLHQLLLLRRQELHDVKLES
jgi:hypothetical protein